MALAEADGPATSGMLEGAPYMRAVIDALDEPVILVEGRWFGLPIPRRARCSATRIEGRDVRLAIRHPQALDRSSRSAGEFDLMGIGDPGAPWRLVIEDLDGRRRWCD